jgi:hypothetical protein
MLFPGERLLLCRQTFGKKTGEKIVSVWMEANGWRKEKEGRQIIMLNTDEYRNNLWICGQRPGGDLEKSCSELFVMLRELCTSSKFGQIFFT